MGGRPSEAARPRATVGSDLPVSMLNDAHATASRWWRSLQPVGGAQEVRLVPRLQARQHEYALDLHDGPQPPARVNHP